MADKPNKSNKPINGQSAHWTEGTFEARRQDIESIGFRSDVGKAIERADKLEEDLKLRTPGAPGYQDAHENLGYAFDDVIHHEDLAARSINNQYAGMIATATKERNINKRTTTASGKHQYYRQAKGSSDIYRASEEIESSIESRMEQVHTRGSVLAGRVRGLGQEDIPESLHQEAAWIQKEEGQIAYEKRLLKVQNKAGLSTEKLFGSSEAAMERTGGYLGRKGMESRVASGNIRSIGEETADLGLKQRDLFVKQQQYDTGMEQGAGSKEMKEFAKALKDATSALEEQQDVIDEMNRQGVKGPGGNRAAKAQAAFGVLGIAANTASTIGLDYELEQTQLRTGFAGLANRQYQKTDAMLGGDMSAMLELTQGDKFKELYANRLAFRANAFKGAEAVAAGGDAIAQGVVAKAELMTLDPGGGYGAAVGAVGAGANAIKMGTRVGMGLESGGYGLKGAMSALDLAEAINAVPADQMQTYYDVNRGAFDAGVGLGGQRNQFMQNMTDSGNISKFTAAGLSATQAVQAAGMAVRNVGVTEDYSTLALRAGRAKQAGVLGIGDYMGNVGQLADVGGGSADLESIMSKAISAGMENAKNINQMVASTSKLAASSAAMGMSTVGASSDMLAASIQSMRSMGVNENIATGAAANALDAANQAGNVKGSFADLQYRASNAQRYGNLGLYQEMGMRNLDQAKFAEILDGSEEGRRYVEESGLGSTLGYNTTTGKFNSPQDRLKFEATRRAFTKKQIIEEVGPQVGLSEKGFVDRLTAFRMGDEGAELTEKDKLIYSSMTERYAKSVKYNKAAKTKYFDQDQKGQGMFPNRPVGEEEAPMIGMDITGAGRVEDKYKGGEDKFSKMGGMAGLVEIMEIARDAADPKKMEEVVKTAAADLKVPTDLFGGHVLKFDGAVKAFVNGMKEMGVSVPEVEAPSDKIKKESASTSHRKKGVGG